MNYSRINLLWLNSGVDIYTPHRHEFLKELSNHQAIKFHTISDINISLDIDSLNKLNEYIKKEKINFVLIEPWHLIPSRLDESFFNANIIYNKSLISNCAFLNNNLNRIDCKKILLGPWLDIHNLTDQDTNNLIGFLEKKNYLYSIPTNNIHYEISSQSNVSKRKMTQNYKKIEMHGKFKAYFIPYIHSFSENKLTTKEFIFNMPGSFGAYPGRRSFLASMMQNKNIVPESYWLIFNYQKEAHKKIQETKDPKYLFLSNYYYNDLIAKSKYNYVDGGVMNYPIRKYIEVPALGSVIISPEILALKDLGLEKGIHYVLAEGDISLENLINEISEEKYNSILNDSRELIFRLHTNKKRIDDFINVIQKINMGEYIGSEYKKGIFSLF
jgi:hypothetical protein